MGTIIIDPVQEYNDANSLSIREGGALLCIPDEGTPANSVFWQSVHGYYEEEEPEGHFAIIDPTTRAIIGFTDLDIDLGPDYQIYHAIYDSVNEVIWAIGNKGDATTYYLTKFDKDGSILAKESFVLSDYVEIGTYTYINGPVTKYFDPVYTVFLTLNNAGNPHLIFMQWNQHYWLENPYTEYFVYATDIPRFKIIKMSSSTGEYVSTVYTENTKIPAVVNSWGWWEYNPPHNKYFPIFFDENDDIWIHSIPVEYSYYGWWKESTEEFYGVLDNPFDIEDTEPIYIEGNIIVDMGGLSKVVSGISTTKIEYDNSTRVYPYNPFNIFDAENQKILFYVYDNVESIDSILEYDLIEDSYLNKPIKLPNPLIYGMGYIANSSINFINAYQNIYLFSSSTGGDLFADYRVLAYMPKDKLIKNPIKQANIVFGESEGGGVPPPE